MAAAAAEKPDPDLKPILKKSPSPTSVEDKPSDLLGGIRHSLKDCMKNMKDEICNAYVLARQKVEMLQARWFDEDNEYDGGGRERPAAKTKSDSTGSKTSHHNVHQKFHVEVVRAIDAGDFKKLSAALEKHYSDQFMETRVALDAAADGHKLDDVEWALDQLKKHGMHSAAITKTRDDYAIKRLKRDLQSAQNSKNLNTLDCFVWDAFNDKTRKDLGTLLSDAVQLRTRLHRLRCIRAALLHIDNAALFDIFNNNDPPPALHATMAATLLLLGKSPKDLNSWSTIQKFLKNKDPKKSVKMLVSKFTGDVTPAIRGRAQRLLDAHDQKSVHEACKHALMFYIWVQAMLKEMETQSSSTLARIFANM